MQTEGMIETIEYPTGTNAEGKTWEKIELTVNGNKYSGWKNQWKKLVQKEGTWVRIDWKQTKYGREMTTADLIPIPTENQLQGLDKPHMADKDIQIGRLNCNTASATVLAAHIQAHPEKYVDFISVTSTWLALYEDDCKRLGLE